MGTLSRSDLLRLAQSGAAARVKELQQELESIFRSFPGLRRGSASHAAGTSAGSSRSKAWSPAKRKAVSDRMRKYWAARKAATARKK